MRRVLGRIGTAIAAGEWLESLYRERSPSPIVDRVVESAVEK